MAELMSGIAGTVVILVVVAGLLLYAALRWSVNIRNLLGIRKDYIELEKTELEVGRMKSRIQLADRSEVERYGYDKRVIDAASREREARARAVRDRRRAVAVIAVAVAAGLGPPLLASTAPVEFWVNLIHLFFKFISDILQQIARWA